MIINHPSHYREDLFAYFKDGLGFEIRSADLKNLKIRRAEGMINNRSIRMYSTLTIGPFYFSKGLVSNLLQYDLIICTGDLYFVNSWYFLLISIFTKTRVYLWTHGLYGKEHRLTKTVKVFYYKLATGLLLYGSHSKQLLMKSGVREEKLLLFNNSLPKLNTQPLKIQEYDTRAAIVFIGRLTRVKKLHELIQAFNILIKIKKHIRLIIIGNGIEYDNLKTEIRRYGLSDSVEIIREGFDESFNRNVLENAAVCVSPGNVGLTAIHSMSYGCPVITHDCFKKQMPEFESIIPGLTGDFFKYGDVSDLAQKIHDWIEIDVKRRLIVRRACKQRIASYFSLEYQKKVIKGLL